MLEPVFRTSNLSASWCICSAETWTHASNRCLFGEPVNLNTSNYGSCYIRSAHLKKEIAAVGTLLMLAKRLLLSIKSTEWREKNCNHKVVAARIPTRTRHKVKRDEKWWMHMTVHWGGIWARCWWGVERLRRGEGFFRDQRLADTRLEREGKTEEERERPGRGKWSAARFTQAHDRKGRDGAVVLLLNFSLSFNPRLCRWSRGLVWPEIFNWEFQLGRLWEAKDDTFAKKKRVHLEGEKKHKSTKVTTD